MTSHFEAAKYLTKKARIQHCCHQCNGLIRAGEFYFKETVDMWPPKSLVLFNYCEKCGVEHHLNRF